MLISTLFALNVKEKPKVDAHLQYQLQDSGIMYPYLLGKWILWSVLSITCGVSFLGTSNFYTIFIFSDRVLYDLFLII